jgi:hypothetical protein
MRARERRAIWGATAALACGLGCNAILGIGEPTVAPDASTDAGDDADLRARIKVGEAGEPPETEPSAGDARPDAREADGSMDANGPGAAAAANPSDRPGAPDANVEGGGCSAGLLSCDAGCVENDVHNCGACGHDCTTLSHVSGAVECVAGVCSFSLSSCAPGWSECGEDAGAGCETNVTTASNCGSCGNGCDGGAPLCAGSGSAFACSSGCPANAPTPCGSSCVDTTSSAGNCKTCGNACTTTVANAQPVCATSACTFACNTGYAACNGSCVDFATDDGNCGGCGAAYACAGGKTCQSSQCACTSNSHDCQGTCVANTSIATCGSSCTSCPAPSSGTGSATCDGTACGISCTSGTACGGACVDTTSNASNCQTCGHTCPYGLCQGSQCVASYFGDGAFGAGPNDVSIAANQLAGAVFFHVGQATSLVAIDAQTTTAGVTLRMGVYASDTNGLPTTLIAQTGELTTVVGVTEGRISATPLAAAAYWILALPKNTVHFAAETSTFTWRVENQVGYGPMPAVAPATNSGTADIADFYVVTTP